MLTKDQASKVVIFQATNLRMLEMQPPTREEFTRKFNQENAKRHAGIDREFSDQEIEQCYNRLVELVKGV